MRVDAEPAGAHALRARPRGRRAALIAATTVRRPKGSLTDGDRTWQIETDDQLTRAEQFRPVVIARDGDARAPPVRRRDGHRRRRGPARRRLRERQARRAASILFRSPSANIIETRRPGARARCRGYARRCPRRSTCRSCSTGRRRSARRCATSRLTLLASVVLVTLVVFAFLRNVRAALIPSVAVPVSLVGTFGVMYLCGYSLDNLSLMALTVATGLRRRRRDRRARERHAPRRAGHAAARGGAASGAREIGFTVRVDERLAGAPCSSRSS